MSTQAQQKALSSYRTRLGERGLKRFEVLGRESDRELFRMLARQLCTDGPAADKARRALQALLSGEPPATGGILAALRRSPLVDADLDLTRAADEAREVDL